jgi:hypothetical protein
MNTNETKTPIMDKFTDFIAGTDDTTHLIALDLLARDLECQLADAREQINEMEIRHAAAMLRTQTIVDESNVIREQRDRLRDDLVKIATGKGEAL